MDKKDPIPFRAKKRERQMTRNRGPSPAGGGELDDVRAYWQRFFHQPFGGPGRLLWTDRMFWGNALAAALLTAIATGVEAGFQVLLIITSAINTFFIFFLIYYLMAWVTQWLLVRLNVRQASTDAIRLELIVLSGWLVAVSLLRIIPLFQPWLYDASVVGFGILAALAVRRSARASWRNAGLATLGGGLSVIIVSMLLTRL